VITTVMSTVIDAGRARVWRALTAPDEVVRWDERTVALVDPQDGYPRVGEQVRWRYRLGTVRVIRHERPLEVAPGLRLRSSILLGGLRFGAGGQRTARPLRRPPAGGGADRHEAALASEMVRGRPLTRSSAASLRAGPVPPIHEARERRHSSRAFASLQISVSG
jgi:hypothetical protein